MDTLILVFSAIFGLIIGSFLNVCIYRIPREKSIVWPPSFCPKCGAHIKPYDNIPLFSYIFLWGKCRKCKAPISIQYPIVEAVTLVRFRKSSRDRKGPSSAAATTASAARSPSPSMVSRAGINFPSMIWKV